MPVTVKPSITAVTQYTIPSHLAAESPNLIKFVEYYYKWMQQTGNPLDFLQNMLEYRDFDTSVSMFSNLISNHVSSFLPANTAIDKQLISSNIKDFYRSKGTLPSYEFIMNAVFGEHVSLYNNSSKVFRASSAEAVRTAHLAIVSDIAWNDLVIGAKITQSMPSIATCVIDDCVSTIVNGKNVNFLSVNPDSVVGTFTPYGAVSVLRNSIDRSWYLEKEYYDFLIWNPDTATLTLNVVNEEKRQYPDLIMFQVGTNFRAIVDSLVSRIDSPSASQVTVKIKNITGNMDTSKQFYMVSAAEEFAHYNKGEYLTGLVSPTINKVEVTSGGSFHEVGEHLEYYAGSGTEFKAEITDVSGGEVDTIMIMKAGHGYSVGDNLLVDTASSSGRDFSAYVSKIDGHGAELAVTMEIESTQIKSAGYGYSVGDIVTLDMNGITPAKLMVSSVSSSNSLYGFNVIAGGNGYAYCKIAAYLTGTFNPIAESISFTPIIKNTQLSSVSFNATTLSNTSISIAVNGVGCTAHCTVSGGVINTVIVDTSGFNYQNPILVIGGVGKGATLTPTLDSVGRITAIVITAGGTGYTTAPTIIVQEMFGSGANVLPLITTNNSVTGLTITDRGAYNGSLSAFNVTVLPRKTNGLVLNLTYRIKQVSISKAGMYYKQPVFDNSDGIGKGAILSPVIANGVIKAIVIDNGGTGYTNAQVSITGTGYGFKGLCSIVGGVIQSIVVLDGGQNYSALDSVSFYGNGTSAAAHVTVADGVVKQLNVYDGGAGYAYNSIVKYKMNSTFTSAVEGVFYPIITNGKVSSITVASGGSGYVESSNRLVSETGNLILCEDGSYLDFDSDFDIPKVVSGSSATFTTEVSGTGSILSAILTSQGQGYKSNTEVTPISISVLSNTGNGAVISPIIEAGSIIKCNVLNAGSGYSITDTIVVTGSGTGAILTPTFNLGKLIGVKVSNGGSSYQYGLSCLVIGDGRDAAITADVNTAITDVVIISGGASYYAPVATISDVSGVGAEVTLSVSGGVITGATIISGGSGYVKPTVTISDTNGGSGSGANVKLTAKRNIKSLTVTNVGRDYNTAQLYIIGDGTGATADLSLEENGSIKSISLVNQGTGYVTTPNIVISDASRYGAVSEVTILNSGSNYSIPPLVSLPVKRNNLGAITASGAEFLTLGNNIGSVREVSFTSFGAEWGEIPKIKSPLHLIVNSNVNLKVGEKVEVTRYPYREADNSFNLLTESGDVLVAEVTTNSLGLLTESGDTLMAETVSRLSQEYDDFDLNIGPSGYVYGIDYSRNLVELSSVTEELIFIAENGYKLITENGLSLVDEASNTIKVGDTIIGKDSKASTPIIWMNRASMYAVQGGLGFTSSKYTTTTGMLNHPDSKVHNGERIQDFAYVVKSGISFNDYAQVLTDTVHPAGYKMYGDLVNNTYIKGPTVLAAHTYGISQGEGATNINLRLSPTMSTLRTQRYKGMAFYDHIKNFMYSTEGSRFKNFTFRNFNPLSIDYISCIAPVSDVNAHVSKSFLRTGNTTVDSDVISSYNTTGINIGYRVIGYSSTGASVFRENRLLMEDGFNLLCEDGSILNTVEQDVYVKSVTNSTTFVATKNANSTIVGATFAVENIPRLHLA